MSESFTEEVLTGEIGPGDVVAKPTLHVYTKEHWVDEWTEQLDLEPIEPIEAAAPATTPYPPGPYSFGPELEAGAAAES